MSAINRRDLFAALPGLTTDTSAKDTLSESEVFFPERMPSITRPNGARSWSILHGELATGEAIALHKSEQPPAIAPNPAHTIQHSEFIFVQQGTLLFEHDEKSETVGAGGVIFVAFGTKHSARNAGEGPARYLVVAIGGDTK